MSRQGWEGVKSYTAERIEGVIYGRMTISITCWSHDALVISDLVRCGSALAGRGLGVALGVGEGAVPGVRE